MQITDRVVGPRIAYCNRFGYFIAPHFNLILTNNPCLSWMKLLISTSERKTEYLTNIVSIQTPSNMIKVNHHTVTIYFMRFIDRTAMYKFDNTDLEEMDIVKKIEIVLDELFACMG